MGNPFASETELKILKTIQEHGPLYGLQICNIGRLRRGTVYSTLGRMQSKGLVGVRVDWQARHPGMPRPVYSVSRLGEKILKAWESINR